MTLAVSDICNVDNLLLNEDYITLCQLQKKMKKHRYMCPTKYKMPRYSGEPSIKTNILEKHLLPNYLSGDTLDTDKQTTDYKNILFEDAFDDVKIKHLGNEDVMFGHNIDSNFELPPHSSMECQRPADEEESSTTISQQDAINDDLVSTFDDAPSNMTTTEMQKYLELGLHNFAAELENTNLILDDKDPLMNEQIVGMDDLDRDMKVIKKMDTYDEGEGERRTGNEMQLDLVTRDVKNTNMDMDTDPDEGNWERILVPNFAAARFRVPSDGSCLYHALSFYVEKKGHRLRVVNPHGKRNALKKTPTLNYKVSNFLKEWINHFIFDHIDLLSQLFDKAILDEEHMCMDLNKLKSKLKKEALEAMAPASPAWGGSLQIHTFALLTKTNVCVWTVREDDMYEKIIETDKTLTHLNQEHMKPYMKKIEKLCNKSQVTIESIQQEIHLYYSDSHYEALDFFK